MTVLVDIDHTLSDAYHRDWMIGIIGWDDYHIASIRDAPLEQGCTVLQHLQDRGDHLVAITSRPVRWRSLTVKWMVQHCVEVDEILMRHDDDFRQAPELKMDLAMARFGPDLSGVDLMLEDRDDVIKVFTEKGVPCLQFLRSGIAVYHGVT